MKSSTRNAVIGVLLLALLAAGAWWARGHAQFNWHNLGRQLAGVDWRFFAAALAAIYVSAAVRAVRWKILWGGGTSAWKLVAAQFIGFSSVALFGRVADLTRPYLIARRTHSAVATQLAVYSIERAFDLAAAAILFSVTLAFAPRSMPHHEAFARAGVLALGATVFLAAFALCVRWAGETLARVARRLLRPVSHKLGEAAATRTLEFRDGMTTIATARQLFAALAWSLVVWGLIALSYFLSARSFRLAPLLDGFTIPETMLLMATSMGGSLLQLPVVGWFTQVGVLAVALHGFFGVPLEVATACAVVIVLVTTLGVVPGGLIAARVEGVSLREAVSRGEAAAEAEPEAV